MQLHIIDIIIIFAYLLLTIFIGFWISKKAASGLDSYFLGNKSLPWYILGVSNASGMFDITGTMWLVYLTFVYGLKGIWIPWLWPVFNQIFLMIYLSVWLRRSNVLTGAEWITTRFGKDKGANLAHISVVIFALVSVIGFLAYDFKGIGKFATIFLPWQLSDNTYAIIIMGITTLYVVKGGMFSVVLTEILQFTVMTIASIAIGIIAIMNVSPEALNTVIPEGWKSIFFGWKLDLDWSNLIASVNDKITADDYSLFSIFFMMIVFKGILVSLAGPAPNYDMQRVLATRSPKEAAKMSGFVSVVLFFPRYMMIAGLTVLALVYFSPELNSMGANIDFELILPYTIKNFVPIGLMGVLLAGLLSAFMSTFSATVNAGSAYIVNDIYKRFINPDGSQKTYIRMSYLCSLVVVIVGIGFGFIVESIDSVTQWIVTALFGGYAIANVLKWYWWRLNGYGYFWGMISGIAAALAMAIIHDLYFPHTQSVYLFPFILIIALIGTILGSLLTKPEDDKILKDFYSTVRPWGFWKPVYEKVIAENPSFRKNTNFKRDMFNVIIGVIWQTTLIALPIYIVIREKVPIFTAIILLLITSFILKKNWLDKIEEN
jgi:SSS family solute:Na+ symporter